jgi:hypothetical protein
MKILLLLLLVSCSSNALKDPEVKTFVSRFEAACKKKVNIAIEWGSLPTDKTGKTIGICRGFGDKVSLRSIVLDKEYWARASYWQRESLVFHELGHCILNRFHVTAYDKDYNPVSIMHPFTFGNYLERRAELVKELCGKF